MIASNRLKGVSGKVAHVQAWVAGSRWAGLAGRAAAYLVGFVLLALVGSGRLSTWLSPPARLTVAIPAAQAATAIPAQAATAVPTASAATAAAPSATVDAGAGPEPADAGAPAEDAGSGSAGVAPDGKVILNLATEEDLRRLPGIGATRAKAILALRARLTRFKRVEDLLKVKGLGRRSIARLRPLVRVD